MQLILGEWATVCHPPTRSIPVSVYHLSRNANLLSQYLAPKSSYSIHLVPEVSCTCRCPCESPARPTDKPALEFQVFSLLPHPPFDARVRGTLARNDASVPFRPWSSVQLSELTNQPHCSLKPQKWPIQSLQITAQCCKPCATPPGGARVPRKTQLWESAPTPLSPQYLRAKRTQNTTATVRACVLICNDLSRSLEAALASMTKSLILRLSSSFGARRRCAICTAWFTAQREPPGPWHGPPDPIKNSTKCSIRHVSVVSAIQFCGPPRHGFTHFSQRPSSATQDIFPFNSNEATVGIREHSQGPYGPPANRSGELPYHFEPF